MIQYFNKGMRKIRVDKKKKGEMVMTEWIICPAAESRNAVSLERSSGRMEEFKMSVMDLTLKWISFDIQIKIGRNRERVLENERRRFLWDERIKALADSSDLRNDPYYQSLLR